MNLTVRCPAKINLFLSVGPPDASGYHPIRTVFQAVSLADTLELATASKDSFHCDWEELPSDNTVTKAWRLAKEYVDFPSMAVTLKKVVPAQSGLGGGSSDAAGLLRGLVHVTKGRFGHHEAAEVAKAIGSDVPFFLVGGRSKAEGYGELLVPLEDGPTEHLVIVMPKTSVSTPHAYAELDKSPRALKEFPQDLDQIDNDFLAVAPAESVRALDLLGRATPRCGLAGSGAAVFGLFDSKNAAERAARLIAGRGLGHVWPCHTLTRKESLWTS